MWEEKQSQGTFWPSYEWGRGSNDIERQGMVKPPNTCPELPGAFKLRALNSQSPRTALASDIHIAHLDMGLLGDKFELVVDGESVFL